MEQVEEDVDVDINRFVFCCHIILIFSFIKLLCY